MMLTKLDRRPELIASVAMGGTYHALPVAYASGRPAITVRLPKEHGEENEIDGIYKIGQHVVIIEDVMTSGRSAVDAVHTCRQAALVVDAVIALVERNVSGEDPPQWRQTFDAEAPEVEVRIGMSFEDAIRYAPEHLTT